MWYKKKSDQLRKDGKSRGLQLAETWKISGLKKPSRKNKKKVTRFYFPFCSTWKIPTNPPTPLAGRQRFPSDPSTSCAARFKSTTDAVDGTVTFSPSPWHSSDPEHQAFGGTAGCFLKVSTFDELYAHLRSPCSRPHNQPEGGWQQV